jgi:uncharacterized protein (DUF39 family)
MSESSSEVARLRQQIEEAEQAAQRALTGYAAVAQHQAITARMQRGGEHLLRLISQGRHAEVQALMETDWWLDEGQSAPASDGS